MPNPLDDFLDRDFTCESNDTLRDAIRQQTTRVLRGRRRIRRLGFIGSAAACYLLGLATMWFFVPRSAATNELPAAPVTIADNTRTPSPPEEKLPESPELCELDAQTAPPAERAIRFRKAGDLYLAQANDYASALRCYREAFDGGGDQALQFSPEDNWLVVAIKKARLMEKNNAN
jgi:hypothetical protein